MGDLKGVTGRLPYLAKLGVDAIWLSPFYRSPQADAGYDVADYRDVDPLFGTLADFDEMLQKAHAAGLKVIVDLVPNHTSDEHVWFQEALAAAPGSAARARYMFREGKGEDGSLPPNNWQSIFGGPAWTRVPDGQWYLHLFDTKQPDLNWENEEVWAEMRSVLRFWLDRGVDGFRVDVAHGLVKDPALPDWTGQAAMVEGQDAAPHAATAEAANAPEALPSQEAGHVSKPALDPPSPFFDQDGVHEVYRDWHKVLAEYGPDRMMVAEAWVEPAERLVRYIRPDEMQQAFNFDFLLAGWDARQMAKVIADSLEASASVGAPTTWVLSNHDTVRHPSRFGLADPTTFPKGIALEDEQPDEALGLARARAATLVALALPGSAYVYQGEELGLPEHTTLDAEFRQDPTFFRTKGVERGRDGCRVPLPWISEAPQFGFSGPTADAPAAWLPQPESYRRLAADVQEGVAGSTLELYRTAIAARREHALGTGSLSWPELNDPDAGLLAFSNGQVLVLANMGRDRAALPDGYDVLVASSPEAVQDGSLTPNSAVWLVQA
ncbi:glycoside hydrolase family 13 protein [Paenarthrobacter sp. DKR-5]|uniref:glycoside hydrolase family 13 protein n=1 Tax=Paenarthrobacter sp. DKR-5 TaxID=2835535 RepID=UPI001BDD418F|nr:alpha-amylase family glycosyl hydrolase [Paenarthrobacter sp. DKR-5]MBT1003397.1 glycoside hydrolase family 13 protein [Paenarthrobacter sp. DKR-5]